MITQMALETKHVRKFVIGILSSLTTTYKKNISHLNVLKSLTILMSFSLSLLFLENKRPLSHVHKNTCTLKYNLIIDTYMIPLSYTFTHTIKLNTYAFFTHICIVHMHINRLTHVNVPEFRSIQVIAHVCKLSTHINHKMQLSFVNT